ncbi:MAG: methyl-accepting chemotaxis protein [Oscillospiraceae bacterium]|nr:methyl-accepting chemotaxis protein [Oscillospiraceae bacterium]
MKSVGYKLTSIMLSVILLGIAVTTGISVIISNNVITRESLAKVNNSNQSEAERLDRWLSDQISVMNTSAAMLAGRTDLVEILTTVSPSDASMEERTVDILRSVLKSVLDDNDAFFELYMGFTDGSAVTGSGYSFDYSWWSAPERGWYKLALTDTSRAHITSPYLDAQTGELCVSAVRAVMRDGRLLGVVGSDIFVTDLQNITLDYASISGGYSMLIDTNGDILIHPDKDYAPDDEGKYRNLGTVKDNAHAALWKDISSADGTYKYPDATGTDKYYTVSSLSTTGWYTVTALPTRIVTQPITNLVIIVIPTSIAILLIASIIIYLTVKRIVTNPLIPLTAFMKKAGATGDIALSSEDTATISKYKSVKDEIGQTITACAAFITHVTRIADTLKSVAGGDLTTEVKRLSEADALGNELQKMVDGLDLMFEEINASALQVSSDAKQIADGARSLAQGASEQSATVIELSASGAEITEKTKANANLANQAAELANTIRLNAEKGSRQMGEMVSAVNDITLASQSINKVIKVIDDIAFQTNILALNAAVEAARAGQHGKGFAVVAEEVRNLAAKSADAAKDTDSLIVNSIEKANLGATIAKETAASLEEIVSGINESSRIVNLIAASSEEQTEGIIQIRSGIDQMAQIVRQTGVTAKENAAAGEELKGQSDILEESISRFKLKDNSGFLPKAPHPRELEARYDTNGSAGE